MPVGKAGITNSNRTAGQTSPESRLSNTDLAGMRAPKDPSDRRHLPAATRFRYPSRLYVFEQEEVVVERRF